MDITHPLIASAGRQAYICEQLDCIGPELSKSEQAASAEKRQWIAALREERKEADLVERVESLEARLAEIERDDEDSFGDVVPPMRAEVTG